MSVSFSFSRLILYVQNVEKLSAFYRRHFGFALTEQIPEEWAVLKAGNTEIALHRVGMDFRGAINPAAGSNQKIVLETSGDLEQVRASLLLQGVQLKEIKSYEGFDYLLCDGADPEGNIFQLMQRRKKA